MALEPDPRLRQDLYDRLQALEDAGCTVDFGTRPGVETHGPGRHLPAPGPPFCTIERDGVAVVGAGGTLTDAIADALALWKALEEGST